VAIDRWEEGFDSWTPRQGGKRDDDPVVDPDREALLRLARELAEQRHAEQQHAGRELEQLKQSLRERAEAIAARERELAKLEKRLGEGKPRKQDKVEAPASDILVARERAALERAHALDARERELQARGAGLALAQSQLDESLSERELASAERAQLEERAENARRVEKELAARRIELEQERARLEARAREVDTRTSAVEAALAPQSDDGSPEAARVSELRRLEAKLDARERELALTRQGLDAERNTLLQRERALRRREAAEARQSFGAPLEAPSFSEGLAAFVSSRPRK
jgi:IgA-specific serine endopeptidase